MAIKLLQPILRFTSSLFILFLSFSVKAQISGAYNIGGIGTNGTTSPFYSGAVSVEGNNCLILKSGLQNLIVNNTGLFTNTCEINIPFGNQIPFSIYPNPASAFCILKSLQTLDLKDPIPFSLEIRGLLGEVYLQISTSASALNCGIKINTSALTSGEYYIQLKSEKITTTHIKFLKVN